MDCMKVGESQIGFGISRKEFTHPAIRITLIAFGAIAITAGILALAKVGGFHKLGAGGGISMITGGTLVSLFAATLQCRDILPAVARKRPEPVKVEPPVQKPDPQPIVDKKITIKPGFENSDKDVTVAEIALNLEGYRAEYKTDQEVEDIISRHGKEDQDRARALQPYTFTHLDRLLELYPNVKKVCVEWDLYAYGSPGLSHPDVSVLKNSPEFKENLLKSAGGYRIFDRIEH